MPRYTGRENEYLRDWHLTHLGKREQYATAHKAKHGDTRIKLSRAKYDKANPDSKPSSRNAWRRDWRKYKDSHYRQKFKISLEALEGMLVKQGGHCGICPQVLDFRATREKIECPHVDHCHKVGTIRGILCRWCNQQLGKYEKWPDFSKHALEYLANVER